MTTKRSDSLTLKDKLSRLTYQQACRLLGPDGAGLIRQGGRYELDPDEHVYFGEDLFRVKVPAANGGRPPVVTITLKADARQRLHWNCTACPASSTGRRRRSWSRSATARSRTSTSRSCGTSTPSSTSSGT